MNGGNILRCIRINKQRSEVARLMANYVFTEAVMAVVFSYCVNFIQKSGF